jgi:bloom syndrome protein
LRKSFFVDKKTKQTKKNIEMESTAPKDELQESLSSTFGLNEFRAPQRQVIEATLAGRDVMVLVPTGGGKSLTYQIPAVVRPGFVLVVSPLISLMQNQVAALRLRNVAAVSITSDAEPTEVRLLMDSLRQPTSDIKIVYVSPERAVSDGFMQALAHCYESKRIQRIAIDESHCLVQWGEDFRPEYSALGLLRERFPSLPIMALTATATAEVQTSIAASLRLREGYAVFQRSYNRANLRYEVREKISNGAPAQIFDAIRAAGHLGATGIVYCFRTKDCESVSAELNDLHRRTTRGNGGTLPLPPPYSAAYHAQLPPATRRAVLDAWLAGTVKVVVATIAFGMGIDKPDVRFVHHHTMPKSIEAYYQESGRAGRDGLPSHCILFYSKGDAGFLRHITENQDKTNEDRVARGYEPVTKATVDRQLENLRQMRNYCESPMCRRALQLKHFGEEFDASTCRNSENPCDSCASPRRSMYAYYKKTK